MYISFCNKRFQFSDDEIVSLISLSYLGIPDHTGCEDFVWKVYH